jgi:hypothetical protein
MSQKVIKSAFSEEENVFDFLNRLSWSYVCETACGYFWQAVEHVVFQLGNN